jgi:chromosome partitioning protein
MSNIIAISTNKGGVLKTSLTSNLAALYAQEGKKVLIVDTDNQGNVVVTFGEEPDDVAYSTYDVLVGNVDPKEAIFEIYPNIDVIAANDDMASFEFDVLTKPKKFPEPFYLLKNALEKVKDQYDVIFIDSPPSLGLNTGNVLAAADKVIIPFQPEVYSMRSLTKIVAAIESFSEGLNPELEIMGIVATLVRNQTVLHSQSLQAGRAFALDEELHFFETVIHATIKGANSVGFEGLPAVLSKQTKNRDLDKLKVAYAELYEEVKERSSVNYVK